MWHGMEGMGWGWLGLGMIHMLLFWALVILGIVALIRWLSGGPQPPPGPDSPMDILRKRYASGEITREEYQRMRRELTEAP